MAASDDGAFNFTTEEYASDFAPLGLPAASPSIAFTTATPNGSVPGGKLLLFWSGSTTLKNAVMDQIVVDSSAPDGGVPTAPAASGYTATNSIPGFVSGAAIPSIPDGSGYSVNDILTVSGGTATVPATLLVTSVDTTGAITGVVGSILRVQVFQTGNYTAAPPTPASVTGGTGTGAVFNLGFTGAQLAINDATAPAATPPNNLPGVTNSFITANIGDPNFTTLDDLNVTVNLVHPHLNQLQLTLTYVPTNTTVTLIQSRHQPRRWHDDQEHRPARRSKLGRLGGRHQPQFCFPRDRHRL